MTGLEERTANQRNIVEGKMQKTRGTTEDNHNFNIELKKGKRNIKILQDKNGIHTD